MQNWFELEFLYNGLLMSIKLSLILQCVFSSSNRKLKFNDFFDLYMWNSIWMTVLILGKVSIWRVSMALRLIGSCQGHRWSLLYAILPPTTHLLTESCKWKLWLNGFDSTCAVYRLINPTESVRSISSVLDVPATVIFLYPRQFCK